MNIKYKKIIFLLLLLAGCAATSLLSSDKEELAPAASFSSAGVQGAGGQRSGKTQGKTIRVQVSGAVLEPGIYDLPADSRAEAAIAALFAQPEILVEKRSKKGGMVDVDLRPLLRSLEIRKASAQELTLDVLASAQNPGMNPQLLVAAVARHLPELRPDVARIRRMEIFDEQMEVFR